MGFPNIFKLLKVDLVFIPILFKTSSIFLIRSDSLFLNSPMPLNTETPLVTAAIINKIGSSSISDGTIFLGQLIGFKIELFTTISPY